jgi:dissimilatory sulfite reductase (desulfoviridin) alpha/beta subunit
MLQHHHQPFIFKIIHTGCACSKYASEFAIDGMMKVTVTEEFMPPLVDLIA